MSESDPTPEEFARWAEAIASIGQTAKEAGDSMGRLAAAWALAMEMVGGDETHALTLDELLGSDVAELISNNRMP